MLRPEVSGRFAAAVVLLTAQLGLAVHACARRKCLLTKFWLALAKLRDLACRYTTASELDESVRQRRSAGQVAVFGKLCVVLAAVNVIVLVDVIRHTLLSTDHILSLSQDIVFFILSGFILLRQCRPGTMNASTINVWYSVFMGLGSLVAAPGICNPETLPLVEKCLVPWAGLVSIARGDFWWAAVWQAVFTTTIVSNYLLGDMDIGTKAYSSFFLISNAGITVLCTGWIDKSIEFLLRNEMEVGILEGKLSAANALLKVFYDAVMELDTDLKITNAGNLSGFLQSGAQSFQGNRLTDLIPQQDDQERFLEHMHQTPEVDETLANVMHLAMGSTEGNSREVEVFSFQFIDPAGLSRHLIGLREFSKDNFAVEMNSTNGEDLAEMAPLPIPRREPPLRGEVWFEVDLMGKAVPVTAVSPGFQRLVGPLGSDVTLRKLAVHGREVIRGLESLVNQHINEDVEGEDGADVFPLRLRQQNQTNVLIVATCQVDLSSVRALPSEDDENEKAMPVILKLQNVRQAKMIRKRKSDHSSAGSNSLGSVSRRQGTPMQANGRHVGSLPTD